MSELTEINENGPEQWSEDSSIIDHLIKTFPNRGPSRDDRHVVPADGFGRIQRQWTPDSRMMMLDHPEID
jgi:hypothetical protein